MSIIQRLLQPSNRSIGLAALRVLIAIHIIRKLLLLWPYSDSLFGPQSFTEWSYSLYGLAPISLMTLHYKLVIATCILASLAMLFGFGRRIAIIVVFVCVMMIQETNGWILNGGDNLLRFLLLYLIIGDSFKHLCIRRFTRSDIWISPEINNLWTNVASVCIIGHLCLVYFCSGIAKASSPTWYHGTALYYILQLNRFSQFDLTGWIPTHVAWLCIPCYTVMIWEITFPALVFVPRLRTPALCFGIAMHLGIFISMMIRDFEIVFITIYVMFYKDCEYQYLWNVVKKWWEMLSTGEYVFPKMGILTKKQEINNENIQVNSN